MSGHIERVSVARAEELVGHRLDRRRKYGWDGTELFEWETGPAVTCSGCACDCGDGYPCSHGGAGCDECGYTGKRRVAHWCPHEVAKVARAIHAELDRARERRAHDHI